MVCGLFSSFDPSYMELYGYESLPLKWLMSFVLVFFFCKWRVWVSVSGVDLFDKEMVKFFFDLLKQSMGGFMKIGLVLYSVFFFFFFSNLLGLVPYVFTLSSHLCVNLSVSLVLWLGGVVYSMKKSMDLFLSHMVPLGSPVFLLPLLVLIETISTLIRPLTLAVRLMANVMAGHLIMSLVGGFSSSLGLVSIFPMFIELGFLFFEMCVAVVQAYVFSSLMVMYLAEGE
uniref:ATP synthase subunit a n=1 Tax=Campanulotes compar TaxID=135595 RepID=A0A386JNB7_9NEOP|nr:ATP synthase F0 subunit 6 [Campanulotes compar]AYD72936.1 ATP synthase F0 subunit 6 [Campanulotes compar]